MRHQRHHQTESQDWPIIAPDLIESLDEAREIVRGLVPGAEHGEAEGMAWSLWQRTASGGWRS